MTRIRSRGGRDDYRGATPAAGRRTGGSSYDDARRADGAYTGGGAHSGNGVYTGNGGRHTDGYGSRRGPTSIAAREDGYVGQRADRFSGMPDDRPTERRSLGLVDVLDDGYSGRAGDGHRGGRANGGGAGGGRPGAPLGHRRGGAGGGRSHGRVRRRRRGRQILIGLLLTSGLGLLAAVVAFVIIYARTEPPNPNELATANTTTLYYKDGKSVMGSFQLEDQDRISVPLDQVPQRVQDAIIAAENRTFWTDSGISPTGIARAVWNQARGQSTQGGSTISQQYVKNYYLTQEQTWKRKFKELFITLKIERTQSKQQILQNYLNTSYFGRGAWGIEVAADAYFGKHVQDLTPQEAAVLAAVLRAPNNYDPSVDPTNKPRLEGRYRYVLSGMAQLGSKVTPQQAKTWPLPKINQSSNNKTYDGPNGFLLVQVRKELSKLGYSEREIDSGGLKVTTTFDPKAQRAMEQAFTKNFPKKNAKGVHAGASAVRPGTGEVVAMYGGPDYLKRQFNDATQAKLQPGSTFKAFALAAALENNISLESRFSGNSPFELENGDEVNNEFDEDYGEYVDLTTATRESINTAFADLTVNALKPGGPGKVVDAAIRAGVPEDTKGLDKHAKVALGFASVSPTDMANAYATFAAGGQHTKWHVVQQVAKRSGEVEYEHPIGLDRAFDSDVVSDINHALQDVIQNGTGENEAKAIGRPAAGKTGTHEDETAWFVGYTPQLSTAVAFYKDADGDGKKESLDNVGGQGTFFGGGYPARIWTSFMKAALKGQPRTPFPPPAEVGKDVNPKPTWTPTPTAEPEPTTTVPPGPGEDPGPNPKPTFTGPGEPEPTQSPEPTPTEDDDWPPWGRNN
ncbi:transglycosylase domain-containing protein [Actinopolymorpha sp. B11F2]|uniref:transglycosylase domain-containing protein n=1 Tax=Actinopolymorpha sp. B11F2 TaxID=3160862 RepID=UPI0032E4A505